LIHPMAYDQHDNAWRLARLGVGDWIDFRRCRAAGLAEKLRTLTTSEAIHTECRKARDRIQDARSLEETAKLIEAML